MGVLNVRGVDDDLIVEVKAVALRHGVTLREYVCGALRSAVGVDRHVPPFEPAVAQAPARKVEARHVQEVIEPQPPPTLAALVASRLRPRPDHDPHTCRLYRCGACLSAGVKDKARGL
jgi:hypothetical protein